MIGPEGAADAIAALLTAHVSAKGDELVARLELVRPGRRAREFMRPKLIDVFDVPDIPLDGWPAMLVVAQDAPAMQRVDIAGGDVDVDDRYAGQAVYAVRYRMRVFTWARGRTGTVDDAGADQRPGAEADLIRKRLTLAVREVLLDHLEVDVTVADDPDADPPVPGYRVVGTIDEATLSESYSDVNDDDGDTVAAAWTQFDVVLIESVPLRVAPPTVEAVGVDVEPIHPAL